jgi:hypothetical protein
MANPQQFRGVHYDLARGNYDTVASLRALVDFMAECELNALVLYMEDLWRYRMHPRLANPHAYDIGEMGQLAAYAAYRGVDCIPSLTTLGHAKHILEKPDYRHLAFPGERADFDVLNPAVYTLFGELFDEVLPSFTSPYVFINGDEVNLSCLSEEARALAGERGIGALYGMGMAKLAQLVLDRGRRPILWHDMLLHHPDSLAYLPKEAIIAYWFYDFQPEYHAIDYFTGQGYDVIAAPGILRYDWLPDDARALPSIAGQARAADANRAHGAGPGRCLGTMTTIWEKLKWRGAALSIYATGRWTRDAALSTETVLAEFASDVFGMDQPQLGAAWRESTLDLGTAYLLTTALAGPRDAEETQAIAASLADTRAHLSTLTAVMEAGQPVQNTALHARVRAMAGEMAHYAPEIAPYTVPSQPLHSVSLVDPTDRSCRVIEAQTSFGHRLCVLTNGLLAIAVLPDFGATMIEWTLLGDAPWSVVGSGYDRWAAQAPRVPGDPALGSPWGAQRLGGWRNTIYFNARLHPSSLWGRPFSVDVLQEADAVSLICRGANEVAEVTQAVRLVRDARTVEVTTTAINRFMPGYLGIQPNPVHQFPGTSSALLTRTENTEQGALTCSLLEQDGTKTLRPRGTVLRVASPRDGHYIEVRFRADEVNSILMDVAAEGFTLEPFRTPRFCAVGEGVAQHLTYEVG